jgi:hypothetical protein
MGRFEWRQFVVSRWSLVVRHINEPYGSQAND